MTVSGENAKYWTSKDATLDERLIIGLLYLLSAIIFLILQISTIIVFISYKDFRAHLCYRVMLFISMADSIQLVIHAYGGIITLFNDSFNTYLEKVAGGLANSLSLATWPLCFVLALNRMLVFLPKKMRERRERLLFNWLIGISLLHGFPFMAMYLTPHSTLSFRFYSWDYVDLVENDPQIWDWVEQTTETLPLPYIVCTFFVYLAIFGILLHQRQKVSSNGNNTIGTDIRKASSLSNKSVRILGAPKTSTQQQLIQHERRLLFQAKVQFVVEFSLCSIWFWQMIDPNCPDGLVFTVFVNWYWIFYNGFKPLVYLAMNRTIRERLFTLWLNRPRIEETIMKNFRVSPHERTMFTRTPNNRRPMPTVNLPTRKAETD